LEAVKGGIREASQERVAIVQPGEEERDDQLGASFLCEIATNGGNTTEVEKAGFNEEGDVGLHGQSGVQINAEALDSMRERHSSVIQLKIGSS
jgi:hypothetical protein